MSGEKLSFYNIHKDDETKMKNLASDFYSKKKMNFLHGSHIKIYELILLTIDELKGKY